MTRWAHSGYLVRYLKQFDYIKQTRNGKIHRHNKSLFISNELRSVTRSGVLDYILKSTQYKHFPQKKKKKRGTKEKDRKRSVIGRKEKRKKKMGTEERERKKKKQMRKQWKKKEERKEKRGGEVERRRKKIKRKTESAAQKTHRPLRTHSLAES